MVSLNVPRFLLTVEVTSNPVGSRWRFVFQKPCGETWLQASDDEPDASGERLELLTVVRALEALDQPSLVTLVSANPYVLRGLRFGISEWRASNWQWERFGVLVPVKDDDLWRRFDRALRFHSLTFQPIRIDSAHLSLKGPTRRRRNAMAWNRMPRRPAQVPVVPQMLDDNLRQNTEGLAGYPPIDCQVAHAVG